MQYCLYEDCPRRYGCRLIVLEALTAIWIKRRVR
jgi:hypothetical protein